MEQSRRAVESYWRSRMIDAATSEEDKITPVYKLEEISDLIRSSHGSIVKEVSEFILKRLEHKSPIVKQKALRVIKYAMGKSGSEFRREMQRNSVAVRQLIHYKGQPDRLKGDALNKAVRETAQEALSSLFSSDEVKLAPAESSLGSRIQGFGSTNYVIPSEDKKSFISEVVDIGSSTIIQGLNSFTQSPSLRKHSEPGSYKSPNLRRSLTRESDYSERYEGNGSAETHSSSRFSTNAASGNWGKDSSASNAEADSEDSTSTYAPKSREEKLLETVVTSGGVRLQPTRDALHVFMVDASKVNALSLGHAIEAKLKSPMWQVRMKAICVLEAVLRKKEDDHLSIIASYFSDNSDVVMQCSESPQASLREKANKVLSLLGGEALGRVETQTPQHSIMPDLIDTGGPDDLLGTEDPKKVESEPRDTNTTARSSLLIDDLLGDSFGGSQCTNELKLDDDPFADVSFHTNQNKVNASDLFSGLDADQSGFMEVNASTHRSASEQFDFFNSSSETATHGNSRGGVNDLIGSLSINENDLFMKQNGKTVTENVVPTTSLYPVTNFSNDIVNTGFDIQPAGMNANSMPYNFPLGLAFVSQSMNSATIGSLFAQQQQFIATMSNFQQRGNLQQGANVNTAGSIGGNAFPDIFNPAMATQSPTSLMNDSRREETKAFDFISDHMAAARDPKRVV